MDVTACHFGATSKVPLTSTFEYLTSRSLYELGSYLTYGLLTLPCISRLTHLLASDTRHAVPQFSTGGSWPSVHLVDSDTNLLYISTHLDRTVPSSNITLGT
jgi:hypothetical protein